MVEPNDFTGCIVVGIDGSDHSRRALFWAGRQAELERRPLVLVHSCEVANLRRSVWMSWGGVDLAPVLAVTRRAGRAILAESRAMLRQDHPDVEVRELLDDEDARDVLTIASQSAHLVVTASRGRGPVRTMLGSVSAHLSKHSGCPVVVCRPHESDDPRSGVLIGIEGSAADRSALEFAFGIADARAEPLTVMHCFWEAAPPSVEQTTVDDELRLVLAEASAGYAEAFPNVAVTLEATRGLIDVTLAEHAESRALVVVGRPRSTSMLPILRGYTALAVLERANTAVAVVPEVDA